MKNKTTLSIFAFAVVALLGFSMVMAYQGNPAVMGPNYSENRHTAMENAFESGDYNEWVALMTENGRHPGIVDKISEEDFATFAQIHELMEEGDFEAAQELKSELGLGQGRMLNGFARGFNNGQRNFGNCPFQ